MNGIWGRRTAAVLLALMMSLHAAGGTAEPAGTEALPAGEKVCRKGMPAVCPDAAAIRAEEAAALREAPAAPSGGEEGSSAEGNQADENRLMEDEENGFWEYRSPELTITVTRYRETVTVKKKSRIREYCIAEIRASPDSPLVPVMSEATKKHPAGYKLVSPELLDEKASPLFAMSDDMYGIRLQKYKYQGIVIRNGEILAAKTRDSTKKRNWPNLDTLALFPDGSMKAFVCDAYTPEEYLAMGAEQVFSFGPVLISEGKINEEVLNPKYYPYNEPRVAMGMIEPWHYLLIVVRGRPTSGYAGVHLDWLAEKMLEMGCVEALNLDGGQTAIMMFNGKIIMSGSVKTVKKQTVPVLRSQGSLITFGTRDAATSPAE